MASNLIFADDEPASMPSMPTQWGGDPTALGRVDHYDILRKLGGGGFGVVYLARDTAGDVEVAIKTLHPLIKHNAEEMDLLREKFKLVSRLSHPNIATALVLHPCRDIHIRDEAARHDLRLSQGDSVIVMRYAPGITLSKWRRQFADGIVPLDLAREIGRQIASALDYAHGERIIHRDVKPGNVMVETPDGANRLGEPQGRDRRLGSAVRVRLLDFGLAAEIRSSMSRVSTEACDTSGTRPYMAPEQWLGRKQDGRTDQYALACLLYELLSGAPPFAGVFETGDPMIMKSAVVGDDPEEVEGLPIFVQEALKRALAKNPKDRFGSCSAFIDAIAGEESVSAPSTPGVEDARNPRHHAAPALGDVELEAEVLRRKVAAKKAFGAISNEERKDRELLQIISEVETDLAAMDEAIGLNRFAAAEQCVRRAETGLSQLREVKNRKAAEAERRAREEEAKKVLQKAAAEGRAREEAEKKALQKAEAERKRIEDRERLESQLVAGTVKTVEIEEGVTMELCWCPATTSAEWKSISGGKDYFLMGSPNNETGRSDDERQHPVRLTCGFWMARTPVTQGQWEAVMGDNPSHCLDGKNFFGFGGKTSAMRPVEYVSWSDCQEFIERLNETRPLEAFKWALPTEAQWEYACRAGTTGAYSGTGKLDDMGWYEDNSGGKTSPVGQKRANHWGLYDMHGNVWEWCSDWYGDCPGELETDPTGPNSGVFRVLRGGSYWYVPRFCRSACRFGIAPGNRDGDSGFRLLAFQD